MKHNNQPLRSPAEQAEQMQRILENLLGVLQYLDVERFRILTDQPEDTANDVLLEAMHKTRLEHPGVNRVQKQASRRWLADRGIE